MADDTSPTAGGAANGPADGTAGLTSGGAAGEPAGVGRTAIGVAFVRANESRRPDALFHDPYARRFVAAQSWRPPESLPDATDERRFWLTVVEGAVVRTRFLRLGARRRGRRRRPGGGRGRWPFATIADVTHRTVDERRGRRAR